MVAILHFTLQWREVQFRKDVSGGGALVASPGLH